MQILLNLIINIISLYISLLYKYVLKHSESQSEKAIGCRRVGAKCHCFDVVLMSPNHFFSPPARQRSCTPGAISQGAFCHSGSLKDEPQEEIGAIKLVG